MRNAVRVVLASPEECDSARPKEAAVQDVIVVRADFRLTRPLLKSCLWPALLHDSAAQNGGCDPVEQGRLMELDERIGVLPVPRSRVPTVDQRDMHICV